MIIPYSVRTLVMRSPWANMVILGLNVLMFIAVAAEWVSEDIVDRMVLMDWSPIGFIGYQFLHADILHLGGNMMLLWVFGNALNGIMHDLDYVLAYLAAGIVAGPRICW